LPDCSTFCRRAQPRSSTSTGTSVGAINAAHLAARADRPDHGISTLVELWTSLRIATHLRPRLGSFLGAGLRTSPRGPRWGRALLDPRPFERMIQDDIPWDRLHENLRQGVVQALIVSALNVADGRTFTFVELGPGGAFVPSRDPGRASRIESITADHILASAAIPLMFPSRRVGGSYFCDGGLRFNTPIAPAIRAGVDRLLVVALRARRPAPGAEVEEEEALAQYPNPVFLLGKVLDALLLDPIDHDLETLERFNRVLDALAQTVPPSALAHVGRVLETDRGLPYRRLRTLVFRPSADIGVLALDHFRRRRATLCTAASAATTLLRQAASLGGHVEADFLSYLLFDGAFAQTLIDLGRADVRSRAAEVQAFFDVESTALHAAGGNQSVNVARLPDSLSRLTVPPDGAPSSLRTRRF
jgi:NTE family protein